MRVRGIPRAGFAQVAREGPAPAIVAGSSTRSGHRYLARRRCRAAAEHRHIGIPGPDRAHLLVEEADVQPLSVSAPSEAIAAAARTIPRGATYSVVGGDKYDVWAVFRFWLAPRVFTPDYLHAPWVVVVDDPNPKGLPPGRKIALAPGVYALEVTP